jgi:hypothetical protein
MANGLETTEALCKGLTDDGYIVKVVHAATNAELEWSSGRLCRSRLTANHVGPAAL